MANTGDDDDEVEWEGAYEDGHWVWDNNTNGLYFVSNRPPVVVETVTITTKIPTGTIDFRDDMDLIEQVSKYGFQLRFRKRFARKLKGDETDIVTVQDLKDLALYTAPLALLSPMLINLLHLPTTERFIRALILYCQYFLQVSDEMEKRRKEMDTKIRTPACDDVEAVFSKNLSDMRVLVAKEYSILLIGGAETRKYHHMGPQKKRTSLSNKDARMFETLLRMCIQIVWIALSRRSFNKIELEIHRIFKTDIFNIAEHTLRTNYLGKMSKIESNVLLGKCIKYHKKLKTCSPLMNETFCDRYIDYRMMGLGVIKYDEYLSPRLRYMLLALTGPEEQLVPHGVSCGILGMPRNYFDTMLRTLPTALKEKAGSSACNDRVVRELDGNIFAGEGQSKNIKAQSEKKSIMSVMSKHRTGSSDAKSTTGKSTMSAKNKGSSEPSYIYNPIVLPEDDDYLTTIPDTFPEHPMEIRPCSETQRARWMMRLARLMKPSKRRRS